MLKRLVVVTLALTFTLTLASCVQADEKAPKAKQEQQQAVKATEQTKADVSLQELNAKKVATLLRIEGAEAAKKAVEAMILQGQIEVARIDEQIAKKQPEKK